MYDDGTRRLGAAHRTQWHGDLSRAEARRRSERAGINGSIVRDGKKLSYCLCAFVYPNDQPLQVQAGPNGAELLVMQFPR